MQLIVSCGLFCKYFIVARQQVATRIKSTHARIAGICEVCAHAQYAQTVNHCILRLQILSRQWTRLMAGTDHECYKCE